ncbi:MAG: hypothetical protein F4082_03795 [Gammaproteobacteria bacterium]|nr:hypothetical protein [Gammaproteobacteria bacterium]
MKSGKAGRSLRVQHQNQWRVIGASYSEYARASICAQCQTRTKCYNSIRSHLSERGLVVGRSRARLDDLIQLVLSRHGLLEYVYGYQTEVDDIRLLTPELLDEVGQLVVCGGHEAAKKILTNPCSGALIRSIPLNHTADPTQITQER